MSSLQSRTKTWTCWLSLRRFSRCFCPQGFKRDSSSWRAVDLFLWSSWNPFMDHEVDMKQIFTGSFLMRICGWESDASLWSWSLVDDCSYRNTIRFTFCCLKELKQEMLESTLKIYLWFSLVQPIIAKFKSLCGLVSIATCFVLLFFHGDKRKMNWFYWHDLCDLSEQFSFQKNNPTKDWGHILTRLPHWNDSTKQVVHIVFDFFKCC